MSGIRRLELSRRELLIGGALAFGAVALLPRSASAAAGPSWLEAAKTSALVYVSPLSKDGKESTCHGEVWFFVDGGDVVIATGTKGWKARAIGMGRDRAHVWVGSFGPYKDSPGKLASAPGFEAHASIDKERAVFDRLLAAYAVKYADEWGKWQPRFESGYADGSRVVIRYSPIAG
jgi:hypothetical protein